MSDRLRLGELGRFLRDRRARIQPAEAGLPLTQRRRVRGLRREEVAMLAGIGVSWYTSLENGTASGVSEATLLAIAEVLRLSESERHYVLALAAGSGETASETLSPLLVETLDALTIPAYVINVTWDVLAFNDPFRRVWAIARDEALFNAIERLFIHPDARRMHGEHFLANVTPVIAMLRSGVGRYPSLEGLQRLRDRLLAEDALAAIWNDYEINSPFTRTSCTIESPVGTFHYETLDLPVPQATHGLVVQVPDADSRARLFAERMS